MSGKESGISRGEMGWVTPSDAIDSRRPLFFNPKKKSWLMGQRRIGWGGNRSGVGRGGGGAVWEGVGSDAGGRSWRLNSVAKSPLARLKRLSSWVSEKVVGLRVGKKEGGEAITVLNPVERSIRRPSKGHIVRKEEEGKTAD